MKSQAHASSADAPATTVDALSESGSGYVPAPTPRITVYDSDGNTRIRVQPRLRDEVEYKRQGRAGFLRCVIVDHDERGIALRYVGPFHRRFWVSSDSRNFMSLWRDGKRVTQ